MRTGRAERSGEGLRCLSVDAAGIRAYALGMSQYVGAIDQGTTSSRFIVFDAQGEIVAVAQKEHQQIYPQPGWVEHSPVEIARNTDDVIAAALQQAKLTARDLVAVGITNQRETTVVWDRSE